MTQNLHKKVGRTRLEGARLRLQDVALLNRLPSPQIRPL
jgi:hypothetical protein